MRGSFCKDVMIFFPTKIIVECPINIVWKFLGRENIIDINFQ